MSRGATAAVGVDVVELSADIAVAAPSDVQIAAFSCDTAVEEHGPHLPLATDRFQSYHILHSLADEFPELTVVAPFDYGQLTWGLPVGLSVNLEADLTHRT